MFVASSDEENVPLRDMSMTIASSDEESLHANPSFGNRHTRLESVGGCSNTVDITRSGFEPVTVATCSSLMEVDSEDAYDASNRSRNSSCLTIRIDDDDQENFYDVVRLRCDSIHQPAHVSKIVSEREASEEESSRSDTPVTRPERFLTRKCDSAYYLCDKETEESYTDINTSMVVSKQKTTMDFRWKSILLKMVRHLDKFRINCIHTRYLVEHNLFGDYYDVASHLIDVCYRALYHKRVRKHELLPFLREQLNLLYQYEIDSMDSFCADIRRVREDGPEIIRGQKENVKRYARSLENVLLGVPENKSSFLDVRSTDTNSSMTELFDWVQDQGLNSVFIESSNNTIIPLSTSSLGNDPQFEQITRWSYLKSLNERSSDVESDFEHFEHTPDIKRCFERHVRELLESMMYHKMLCQTLEQNDYEKSYKLVCDTFSDMDDDNAFDKLSRVALGIGMDIVSITNEYDDLRGRYIDLSKRFVEANNVIMDVIVTMTGANYSASLLDSMRRKYLVMRDITFEEKNKILLFIKRAEADRPLYTRIVNLIKESTTFPMDSTEFYIDMDLISNHAMHRLLFMESQKSSKTGKGKEKHRGKQNSVKRQKVCGK